MADIVGTACAVNAKMVFQRLDLVSTKILHNVHWYIKVRFMAG